MPLDYTILNGNKSLLDQQYMQDAFNQKKALALQSLASGAIDQANKQNAYGAQTVLTAAAGGQDAYDAARAKAAQNGYDLSSYDPDINVAAKQANALLTSQVPLGSLLGLGLKAEGNINSAVGTTGSISGAKGLDPVSNLMTNALTNRILGSAQTSTAPLQQSMNQGSLPIPPKPSALPIDGQSPVVQIGQPGAPIITPQSTVQLVNNVPQFVSPAYDPNLSQQANQAQVENARKDFEASPEYIQQKAKSEKAGGIQADVAKSALDSDQNYQKVSQTLDAIKQMAPTLPQQENFVGPGTRAFLNQNLGNGKMAADYSKFQTINEAQTLGAIQTLADTGQIRMTRTLENIINRGFLVDPNLSPQGKIDQANAIQAELRNAAVAPANVNAQINGGQVQPYSSPLQEPAPTVAATNPNVSTSMQSSFLAKKYPDPDSIKAAYKSGTLTKEQATQLLTSNHGFGQ